MTFKCEVCDTEGFQVQWTDTHGIAQCTTCGTPYQIYHYENDKRVDRPHQIMVRPEWIPRFREYWAEAHRPMPGGFSFTGDRRYEVATSDDAQALDEWIRARYPQIVEESSE